MNYDIQKTADDRAKDTDEDVEERLGDETEVESVRVLEEVHANRIVA